MGFGSNGWYKPVIKGQDASRFYSRQDKYEDTTLYGPLCMPREAVHPEYTPDDWARYDALAAAARKELDEKRRLWAVQERKQNIIFWLVWGGTGLAISAVMLFLAYKGLGYCGCFDNIRETKQQIDKAKTTNSERTAFFEWRSR